MSYGEKMIVAKSHLTDLYYLIFSIAGFLGLWSLLFFEIPYLKILGLVVCLLGMIAASIRIRKLKKGEKQL